MNNKIILTTILIQFIFVQYIIGQTSVITIENETIYESPSKNSIEIGTTKAYKFYEIIETYEDKKENKELDWCEQALWVKVLLDDDQEGYVYGLNVYEVLDENKIISFVSDQTISFDNKVWNIGVLKSYILENRKIMEGEPGCSWFQIILFTDDFEELAIIKDDTNSSHFFPKYFSIIYELEYIDKIINSDNSVTLHVSVESHDDYLFNIWKEGNIYVGVRTYYKD